MNDSTAVVVVVGTCRTAEDVSGLPLVDTTYDNNQFEYISYHIMSYRVDMVSALWTTLTQRKD